MNDRVMISHVTKFHAFRNQVIDLETWFKILTMLKHRPPKPYKLLKFCMSFVTTVKFRNSATI